jgi:hypothetical protein
MNHLTDEQLVSYHYGDAIEGIDAATIEEHLHACGACQAVIDEIRRTLQTVSDLDVPVRGEGYGSEVWARIQPSLRQPDGPWWERLGAMFAPRRLALAGGVAVLVAAAFVAGRFAPGRPATTPTTSAPAATAAAQNASAEREAVRERILLVAVGDHLERSQMALVELVNSPGGRTVDISGEQERARNLVTETRLYRQTALTAGEPAVATMLDDLERVLVEIANGPSTMTGEEFSKVRSRIEQQGIIFKVRVFGDRVRAIENGSVANAGIRG